MQLANPLAIVSVGENASPLPLLSNGASEIISEPDCRCIEEVRKSPKYVTLDVAIIVLV
jgi:hypothetical protein